MLHVLNGDATREKLERSGVRGDIAVWADVLHEGPVSDVPPDYLRHSLHDEVVFWFEHDLFDQLLLIRHLHWLSDTDPGTTRFSLICGDEYLGPLSPERLRQLFPTRVPITQVHIDTGARAWNLFRAAEPAGLVAWVTRGGAAPLKFLPAALHRYFEEFPSSRNGLSRTERQLLTAVADADKPLSDVFRASQGMEDAIFMGDWTFWSIARRLAAGPHPLIRIMPEGKGMPTGSEMVSLTETGRRVIVAEEDHVSLNGIDRWLGGVHLTPQNCWRWNGSSLVA